MELFRQVLDEELNKIKAELGEDRFAGGRYSEAAELFSRLTTSDSFAEFLTLPGYELID